MSRGRMEVILWIVYVVAVLAVALVAVEVVDYFAGKRAGFVQPRGGETSARERGGPVGRGDR